MRVGHWTRWWKCRKKPVPLLRPAKNYTCTFPWHQPFFLPRQLGCFYTGQSPDVHSPKGRSPRPMSPPHRPGSRLGAVGVDGAWVRSCPRGGRTPSPLRALSADWLSRDAANACITACVRMADHRAMKEATTVCRKGAGVSRALVWAMSRRKVTASGLQRPPTSKARTTRQHLFDPASSGYVRSLFCRAVCNAAPAYWPPRRRGCAAPVKGETSVVSMASWEPCHNGSPVAVTSMVRSSTRWTAGTLRLARRVCIPLKIWLWHMAQLELIRRFGLAVWKSGNSWFYELTDLNLYQNLKID